jgi:uncharacterized protein YutE (UPF0331/DUF86 family)/predicted nucleotidyltransferase
MNARLPLSTLSQRARDALLDAFPHAAAVYLFGSTARGAARHDSDVDLAVLLPERVACSELFDVQRNVSVALDADVDLIDLSVASTVLQCEVITRGQRIFEREHDHVLDFEARVLTDYGALLEATQSLREHARSPGGRPMNPPVLGKIASIERSATRAREEFTSAGANFARDFTYQDAAVLNVLRTCETAIDLANVIVRDRNLGVPQSSRDSFRLLADAAIISSELSERLQKMIGFRNVAVHQYQTLDMRIAAAVIERDLDDALAFCRRVAELSST